jgi:hypothetical protein
MSIFFLLGFPYIAFVLFAIITIIMTLSRGEKNVRSRFSAGLLIFSEVLFTIIGPAIGFYRFDEFQPEIPFAKQHVLSIILLVLVSASSFWIARFVQKTNNAIVRIVLSVGLLQGIVLCFITSIHFLAFLPLGIIFPFAGFELLSPVVAFFILLREFYFLNKVELDLPELLPYRAELGFIPLPYQILKQPLSKRLLVYGLLMILLLLVEVLLAFGVGQDIDSILKAFTHSVGFIFSHSNY